MKRDVTGVAAGLCISGAILLFIIPLVGIPLLVIGIVLHLTLKEDAK